MSERESWENTIENNVSGDIVEKMHELHEKLWYEEALKEAHVLIRWYG